MASFKGVSGCDYYLKMPLSPFVESETDERRSNPYLSPFAKIKFSERRSNPSLSPFKKLKLNERRSSLTPAPTTENNSMKYSDRYVKLLKVKKMSD
ncbi:hypothetical protein GCM10008932_09820 [Alkalibacterium iburiense]|uniref:Uncharacterized protein n=1 Tax=Alkalibacterium iburiense TaxID=290589 RepID=A0ABN0XA99_9LACT